MLGTERYGEGTVSSTLCVPEYTMSVPKEYIPERIVCCCGCYSHVLMIIADLL